MWWIKILILCLNLFWFWGLCSEQPNSNPLLRCKTLCAMLFCKQLYMISVWFLFAHYVELRVYYPSFTSRSALTHQVPSRDSIDLYLGLTVAGDGRLLTLANTNTTTGSHSSFSLGTLLQASLSNNSLIVEATCGTVDSIHLQQPLVLQGSGTHTVHIR